MSEEEQAQFLLGRKTRYPDAAFEVARPQITLTRNVFKKYFAESDFLEKNRKMRKENPLLDGEFILEKKRSGKFEIVFQERGQVYDKLEFGTKDQLVEYLVDQIFRDLKLP
jgi:hypothetical protein